MHHSLRASLLGFALLITASLPARAQFFAADLGFVSATGNTQLATLNVGEKVKRKVKSWTLAQQTAYIYGTTKGAATANQLRISGRADKTFLARVAFFAGTNYERNRFAGFTRHFDYIAGLSWLALAAPRDTLSLDGGGVYTDELRVDGSHSFSPAARAAAAFKHSFGGASSFVQTMEYIPNLPDGDQHRINAESSVSAKMTSHIGLKLAHLLRYDSKPAAGFRKADRILTTGLQVTY